jgi:hypothetical protein
MGRSKKKKKAAEFVIGISSGVAGALTSTHAGPVAGAVTRSVLTTLATTISDFAQDRRARRANAFAEAFLESGTPDETAAAELRAELQQSPEHVKDAIWAAFRCMEDAICEEVVPALGLLTRSYRNQDRARDPIFIGAARVLRDIALPEEFVALVELMGFLQARWPREADGRPVTAILPFSLHEEGGREVLEVDMMTSADPKPRWSLPWRPVFERVLHLLSVNDLCRQVETDDLLGGRRGHAWAIHWQICNQLAPILRP